jgi:hypothetical protein
MRHYERPALGRSQFKNTTPPTLHFICKSSFSSKLDGPVRFFIFLLLADLVSSLQKVCVLIGIPETTPRGSRLGEFFLQPLMLCWSVLPTRQPGNFVARASVSRMGRQTEKRKILQKLPHSAASFREPRGHVVIGAAGCRRRFRVSCPPAHAAPCLRLQAGQYGSTPAACRLTPATKTLSIRCATLSWRRRASRTSGATERGAGLSVMKAAALVWRGCSLNLSRLARPA